MQVGQPRQCLWMPVAEACDGTNVQSCTDLGFFGGATACISCTSIVTTACEACAPTNIACAAYPSYEIRTPFVVSGSRVAVGNWWYVEGLDDTLSIFDGVSENSRTHLVDVSGIAAIPTGWLIAVWTSPTDPMTLVPLAFDGTLGTAKPLPANITPYRLYSGPTNRVLLTITI